MAANQNGPNRWASFFFGSPTRTMWTLAGFALVFTLAFPGISQYLIVLLLNRMIEVFGPLIAPIVQIAIVGWGIWILLGMPGRKKKKREH